LDNMIARLTEDHVNARRLAEGIAEIPGLSIDVSRVKTNIIYFDVASEKIDVEQLRTRLEQKGIKSLPTGRARFRLVTHYGVDAEDIDQTLAALREIMA
jgi:threonine aldolase